jgi:hypothetical protein
MVRDSHTQKLIEASERIQVESRLLQEQADTISEKLRRLDDRHREVQARIRGQVVKE